MTEPNWNSNSDHGPLPDYQERTQDTRGHHSVGVRRMFDDIAPTYDRLNRMLSFGIDRGWREKAVQTLIENMAPGPVLDLCAGTLDLASEVRASLAPESPIIAVDFSRGMLEKGLHKLAANTVLAVGDALSLPIASESMGGIVCGFGLRNLADIQRGLSEMHRALKPGGVLVGLEFFRPERLRSKILHRAYATTLMPKIGSVVSGHHGAYRYLAKSMEGFLTVEEFSSQLTEAGFVNVRFQTLRLGVATMVWAQKLEEVSPNEGVRTPPVPAEGTNRGREGWIQLLACPACGAKLGKESDPTVFACHGCKATYSMKDGLIDLLPPTAGSQATGNPIS